MKDLYVVSGITKQALWKHKKRQEIVDNTTRGIVEKITDIRKRISEWAAGICILPVMRHYR